MTAVVYIENSLSDNRWLICEFFSQNFGSHTIAHGDSIHKITAVDTHFICYLLINYLFKVFFLRSSPPPCFGKSISPIIWILMLDIHSFFVTIDILKDLAVSFVIFQRYSPLIVSRSYWFFGFCFFITVGFYRFMLLYSILLFEAYIIRSLCSQISLLCCYKNYLL